jgi:hypothetical protein
LTGILQEVSLIFEKFKKVLISGTHMSLLNITQSVLSSLGKENSQVYYTQPATKEDHIEILSEYFDINQINLDLIQNNKDFNYFLLSKKRITANLVKFIKIDEKSDINIEILNSYKTSYKNIKKDLILHIKSYLSDEDEELKKEYIRCLEELIFMSFFNHNGNNFIN